MNQLKPWRSVARTHAGKVRTRNEDAFLDCPQLGLWVVADGMGGHQCGDIASQLIVTHLADLPQGGSFDERVIAMRQCLHWLNRRMSQELTMNPEHKDKIMGSTVVALLVDGKRGACVWAGDSRCYLLRDNHLHQLTRDHSLFEQLINEQKMSPEKARLQLNSQALTRAIGASDQLQLEIVELEVQPDDVFLLCSDGFYEGLNTEVLRGTLSLESMHTLFNDVMGGTARDNLTAIVISQ
ncbi:serine/threonine-protein phosphatase [Pseudomonas sp. CCI3.2]|uniref:PP2C family protein-serine/threonine phosphatase n=1 Tax=unclassified Pseudomonas TaxID=196821 RepID=UPI002AC9AF2F|nr:MULTISPECIES: PP2C family serine/threonine-protein phosphatase [unclassified Pseudomonas]MEB0079626.1 serine/threonine-protein phosphatase [Pseudomonas sp. MH10out]MEB0103832.1 serine/threonine-protein phosphatase [Pseudomonas sp. CCI3.2]MEB0133082.1 serine/threonine-protein phosphatase [Pseudomonas sp. CCI2.4]MEB0157807.1 serine/threonine-protein phosphatase [Pseudomonas sp. AH2 (2023)]MEB0169346.1 serine/threonine-protein phosphatase [Pseudomonas sp. CCC4.4]